MSRFNSLPQIEEIFSQDPQNHRLRNSKSHPRSEGNYRPTKPILGNPRSKPETAIRKRRGFTAADSIARRIPGYRNNDYADVDNYLSRHDGPSRLCPLQMTRTDAIPAFPLCVPPLPVPAPPSLIKASKSSVCLESGHPRRGCRGYPKDQETEGAGRY